MTYGHKEFVTAGEAGAYRHRETIGIAVSVESAGTVGRNLLFRIRRGR